MNPKNVWSVILIVLGVFFILGGVSRYAEISDVEKSLLLLDQMTDSMIGKSRYSLPGMDNYLSKSEKITKNLFNQEKINSSITVLFGILCSISGTLLLKKANSKNKKRKIETPKEPEAPPPENDSLYSNANIFPERFDKKQHTSEPKSEDNLDWSNLEIKTKKAPIVDPISPKNKPIKIINLKTGKDELEEDQTRWMPPNTRK